MRRRGERYRLRKMAPTRRRGLRWRFVTIAVAVCLTTWIIATTVIEAERSQGPYRTTTDRIYAQLVWLIAQRSNQSAIMLHNIRNNATAMSRTGLEQELSDLATASKTIESQASSIPPPAGDPSVRDLLLKAMSDRAEAASLLMRGVDRILAAGSVTTAATSLLEEAGRRLASADSTFARFRRALEHARGGWLLPRSQWITNPSAWKPTGLATFAQSVASASNLFAVHDVMLTTAAITPSAETSVGAVSVLPPTNQVSVEVVIYNNGNLSEQRVPVEATIQPQSTSSGATPSATKTEVSRKLVTIHPTRYLAVDLSALRVTKGTTYLLTIQVGPTSSQPLSPSDQETFTIQIAP